MGLIEGLQAALDYLENPTALTATSVSMCLCWLATYAGMVRKSFQDRSYSMPLMPLCCDIAFEFVFSVLYPPTEAPILQYVFGSWMAGSVMVVFATIRFMPNEWKHAPLVQQNILSILAVTILGWMTAHLALVAQFGADDGSAWGGCLCQLLLGAGSLCQLIVRGSSRGASFFIWLSRFLGTNLGVLYFTLRFRHGHVIWHSPLAWWSSVIAFLIDSCYGILLWHIRQAEGRDQQQRKAGSEIGPK